MLESLRHIALARTLGGAFCGMLCGLLGLIPLLATGCVTAEGNEHATSRMTQVNVAGQALPAGSTYSWLKGSGTVSRTESGPVIDRALREALDGELQRRGLRRVSRERAEYAIGFLAAPTSELDLEETYEDFGIYLTEEDWTDRPTGSLLVLFVEERTGLMLWRGSLQVDLVWARRPERQRERVFEQVGRLLESFPRVAPPAGR